MEITYIPLTELTGFNEIERQPRQHNNPEAIGALARAMVRLGFRDPIGIWTTGPMPNIVLGGHKRILAVKHIINHHNPEDVKDLRVEDDQVLIPCYSIEAADVDEARAILLSLNGHDDDDDEKLLAAWLRELRDTNIEIDMLGVDIEIVDIVIGEAPGEDGRREPLIVEERPVTAPKRVALGDVWQLGPHRLVCGDATDPAVAEFLMNGQRAELLFTSPPYFEQRVYDGTQDLSAEYLAGVIPAFAPHTEYMAVNLGIRREDYEVIRYWDEYIEAAVGAGLKLLSWNVWHKGPTSVMLYAAIFSIEHEFIFVFGKQSKDLHLTVPTQNPGEPYRYHKREQDGSMHKGGARKTAEFKKMSTVIECPPAIKQSDQTDHPAPFLVHLPYEYIRAMTDPEDIVVDPYAGSGSTLIAAAEAGRIGYAIDLNPEYCDIIVERYIQRVIGEDGAGPEPERVGSIEEVAAGV